MFKNAVSYIYTFLFFKKARLIRLPVFLYGKRGIKYGEGLTMGRSCRISASQTKKTLFIGKNARIGDYVHIHADENVTIGDNVLIASKVFISDTSHGSYSGDAQSPAFSNPNERPLIHNGVVIGDNVWIGENVVILPGTVVGNGCVVGANAVLVGRKYEDNVIIAGVPGKVIKKYNSVNNKWERIVE